METTVKEVTLQPLQPMISPIHKDSFWYEGAVAKLTFQDRTIYIVRTGENRWRHPEGARVISAPYQLTAEEFAQGDRLLDEVLKHDGWIHNSWFILECVLESQPMEYLEEVALHYDEAIYAAQELIVDDEWWEEKV